MKRPMNNAASIVRTYTTALREERAARRRTHRLSEREARPLQYLWSGYGADTGLKSAHGALEMRLLLAPPRDVSKPILDELAKRGDWVSEGKLLRVVVAEGWGVKQELRRALRWLVKCERVERREAPMPDVPPQTSKLDDRTGDLESTRTAADDQKLADHTGYEVRLKRRRGHKPEPLTREEKWRREDEAIENELHICHGNESIHSRASFDPPEDFKSALVDKARHALAEVSALDARVLRVVYGQYHATETSELVAVMALVGGDAEAAKEAIERASKAYREASER